MLPTMKWDENKVVFIDQRKLPQEEVYVECRSYQQVAEAIQKMVVRGAPAIGVAAAFGVALGINSLKDKENIEDNFSQILNCLEKTRPTARNLFWALERMREKFKKNSHLELPELKRMMVEEALAVEKEDLETNREIGYWGEPLIKDGDSILTHCNAGALATAGYGTALGVIKAAREKGKKIQVYSSETRPFLQGARLTCWELNRDNIPVTLITDNMAGYLMGEGLVSVVITGADRIAQNGDTANKIGTYSLAILAQEHHLPFYVAAPLNTVDLNLREGKDIPVEERSPDEVRKIGEQFITLPHIKVRNPAFDITPSKYISAIITDKGIVKPPYVKSLDNMRNK